MTSGKLKIAAFVLWLPVLLVVLITSLNLLNSYTPEKSIYRRNLDAYISDETHNYSIQPDNDIRLTALKKFFKQQNSPLIENSETLVRQADENGLDYALLPAIAMQESGGCKRIPVNSHNCWGFGIYGDKVTYFSSYDEAIVKIARKIRESYVNRGLTNATLVEDLWAPPSRGEWSYGVNFFIGKIKEFEKL